MRGHSGNGARVSELRRILLVDDDPALLEALPETISLRLDHVAVDTCDSAPAALKRLVAVDYDAIITDIKMPVMDGLALLAEIRLARPETPVLLITGHGEHDLTVQALRGGAFDFIAKPIDRDYFAAALNRALDVRALRRTVESQRQALESHARNLETRVAERTIELTRANAAKDEFLGMISHEMRTPLTVIGGGLRVLRAHRDKIEVAEQEALLDDIDREAARLTKMVEDLLVLARAETYVVHTPEPIAVGPALLRIADQVRQNSQRIVRLDASADLPLIAGDLTFFERVVENLVSNAIKYSEAPAAVEISALATDGHVTIAIRDRGPGVDPGDLERIFENFFRSPSAEKLVSGYGIGLAVCKRLVEALSGTIGAYPRAGGGLEVAFTVPIYSEEALARASIAEVLPEARFAAPSR